MIKGDVIFCASAITDGDIVDGVKDLEINMKFQLLLYIKNIK